jgi:hypothetical protein
MFNLTSTDIYHERLADGKACEIESLLQGMRISNYIENFSLSAPRRVSHPTNPASSQPILRV